MNFHFVYFNNLNFVVIWIYSNLLHDRFLLKRIDLNYFFHYLIKIVFFLTFHAFHDVRHFHDSFHKLFLFNFLQRILNHLFKLFRYQFFLYIVLYFVLMNFHKLLTFLSILFLLWFLFLTKYQNPLIIISFLLLLFIYIFFLIYFVLPKIV